jgi:hypothetical protein
VVLCLRGETYQVCVVNRCVGCGKLLAHQSEREGTVPSPQRVILVQFPDTSQGWKSICAVKDSTGSHDVRNDCVKKLGHKGIAFIRRRGFIGTKSPAPKEQRARSAADGRRALTMQGTMFL